MIFSFERVQLCKLATVELQLVITHEIGFVMLPFCAFEIHRGHHRNSTDYSEILVEAQDYVPIAPKAISHEILEIFNLPFKRWGQMKFSFLSSLDRNVIRSINHQAVFVAISSSTRFEYKEESFLDQNRVFATAMTSPKVFLDWFSTAEKTKTKKFLENVVRLNAELIGVLDDCKGTIQVLNHYSTTELSPQAREHIIFATPAELQSAGIALDPEIGNVFSEGRAIVPIIASVFLWEHRNKKGREPRSSLATDLFDLACAFSSILNEEAKSICRIRGERRASAQLKRECVHQTVLDAGFEYAIIDGRGALRDTWVEDTILRNGSAKRLTLDNQILEKYAFDNSLSNPAELVEPRERYIAATGQGRLRPLAQIIKMTFKYAIRAAEIQASGYREIRRGQDDDTTKVRPVEIYDGFEFVGKGSHLFLEGLDKNSPDLWTQLALDFGIDLTALYPSMAYMRPTIQVALAIKRVSTSGEPKFFDADNQIEILPIFHLFQTESLDFNLPTAIRASRELLRARILELGIDRNDVNELLKGQLMLPISDTDLAKIRKTLENRERT